jgi:CheY-like chemotaxis protein
MARILVIDDDDLIRLALRTFLKGAGHDVMEAAEGAEGIELHTAAPFDLVISDLFMPGKEGIETIVELRRDYPDLKIIAISSGGRAAATGLLDVAKGLGADRTVRKPFSAEDILAEVDALLAP